MHPHLIDWFRTTHIHSDANVVEKRWKTAQEYSKKLTRETTISLLRLFLFENSNQMSTTKFTNELLVLDKEFPIQNNLEELRLMAGVVMVAAFEDGFQIADLLALGLQAADFPQGRIKPFLPAVLIEARKYLAEEAERLRPGDFDNSPSDIEDVLISKYKAILEAETDDDNAEISAAHNAYNKEIAKGFREAREQLSGQIRRLAEETGLLWWVISEYSFTLKSSTEKLLAPSFALVAAAEAAQRTQISPPPVSINPILDRALIKCKSNKNKNLVLADYLSATDNIFRASQVAGLNVADCGDLVPITTALVKCQEFGDVAATMKVLPNLCSNLAVDHTMSPNEVSHQYYRELMFLKSLTLLKT